MLELPVSFLEECFVYEASSGVLFWKNRPRSHFASNNSHAVWNSKHAGKAAGAINSTGRFSTKINRRLYQNHRIAWALVYKTWPSDQIDHINGDPSDNRIENLRVVTNTDNQKNRWLSKANTSGANGVSWHSRDKTWQAYVRDGRKQKTLGSFKTLAEAVAARKRAESLLGFSQRHGERRSG